MSGLTSRWIAASVALLAAGGVAGATLTGHHGTPLRNMAVSTEPTRGSLVSTDSNDRHASSVTLVAGMRTVARMQSRISSESARVGDEFQATLTDPWLLGSRVVLPAGTKVLGEVSEVEPTGRGKHKAKLVLRFTRLEPEDGEPVPLDARPLYFEAGGETKRDAELIGGGTLVGGIVGKITGNTGRGALLGAAAGTGAAVATKGAPVVIRPGRALHVVLQRDARIPVQSTRS